MQLESRFYLGEIERRKYERCYKENCIQTLKNEKRDREYKSQVFKTQYTGDLTKALEYVKRKMEAALPGERHNAVFGLGAFFQHCGGDYDTFSRIRPSWADKKFDSQMKRLEKEWFKL